MSKFFSLRQNYYADNLFNKLNSFSLPYLARWFEWPTLDPFIDLSLHKRAFSQMQKSTRFVKKLLDQTNRQRGLLLSHHWALRQIFFLQKVGLDWSRPVEPSWLIFDLDWSRPVETSWLIFDCSSKSFKLLLNCFIHLPLQELFKAFLAIRTVMEEFMIRGHFAFGLFINEHFKNGPWIPQWGWKSSHVLIYRDIVPILRKQFIILFQKSEFYTFFLSECLTGEHY